MDAEGKERWHYILASELWAFWASRSLLRKWGDSRSVKEIEPLFSLDNKKNIRYAKIDIELFELMKDEVERKELNECLIHN